MPFSSAFAPSASIADSSLVVSTAERPNNRPTCSRITLSFDRLRPFEIVQNQYSDWGIRFHSAIALQPTNASFQIDRTGIMPMGDRMKLTITFAQPPRQILLQLTGASAIHATLFDACHRPILQPLSRLLPLLPASAAAEAETEAEPLPFPQYELNFSAIDDRETLQTLPSRIYRIELESVSPFVLQTLAIETE